MQDLRRKPRAPERNGTPDIDWQRWSVGLALSNRAVSTYHRFRRPLAANVCQIGPHVGRTAGSIQFNTEKKMAETDA